MATNSWHSISPELKDRARRVLRAEYQRWVAYDDVLLTPEGGWPMDVPVSAAETWSTVMYLLAIAAEQLGRYSEATRFTAVTPDSAPAQAARLRESIDRLAATVLHLIDVAVDEPALLAEASDFVDEVADEDDGLTHTSDRLGSFLQAHLVCAEDHLKLPDSEQSAAIVAILAPLLAQSACLTAFEDASRPAGKRTGPPPEDVDMVVAYCGQRVPASVLDQLRIEAVIDRNTVTIVERRVPWRADLGPEWTASPVARLRWSVSRHEWTLFYCDRHERWHRYPDTEPTSRIETLIIEIEQDPTGIFWG